jgi:hypothetical protein
MALRAPAAHGAQEGEGPEDGSGSSSSSQQRQPPDDEFLVVASDGLWDAVPPPDALRYARTQFKNGKTAQEVAEALAELALKRYTADNTCVAVIDLLGPERRGAGGSGGGGGGGKKSGGGGGLFGGLFGR